MTESDPQQLREQMRLCEEAVLAMKKYHQAKGVLSDGEVQALQERAEFLFADVQTFMARDKEKGPADHVLGQN